MNFFFIHSLIKPTGIEFLTRACPLARKCGGTGLSERTPHCIALGFLCGLLRISAAPNKCSGSPGIHIPVEGRIDA